MARICQQVQSWGRHYLLYLLLSRVLFYLPTWLATFRYQKISILDFFLIKSNSHSVYSNSEKNRKKWKKSCDIYCQSSQRYVFINGFLCFYLFSRMHLINLYQSKLCLDHMVLSFLSCLLLAVDILFLFPPPIGKLRNRTDGCLSSFL